MTNRQDRHNREKPTADSPPSALARLAVAFKALRNNQDLLRNAGSLAATTGITSGLGFAYWIYGARVFSTGAVGYASAAVSTLTLLGTIGMFGLDTMLVGELPREDSSHDRGGLTMAACTAAFGISFILGLCYCLGSLAFGSHTVEINGTVGRMAIFSFGVAITGTTVVFDSATIGLMRGGIQLWRNGAQSVAKMAALPAVALILNDRFGVGIMLSWVIGTVASLIPVAVMVKRRDGRILYRPDWVTLWQLRKLALAHNWLNLAINIPLKLIPVLVAAVVSPASNGAYYIANLVAGFLTMIPFSLSVVLFAVASGAPDKFAEKLRFVLRMAYVIGIPAGLVLGLSAHLILSAFGASYTALATGPLWILIIGYIPGVPNIVYMAVARAKGHFNQAAIFLTSFAVVQMGALVVGAKIDGLYGLSYGMLAVTVVQACITAPSVLRTAYGGTDARSAVAPVTMAELQAQTADFVDEDRLRQEAGLAAIISLARLANVGVTAANPALTDTHWWPDINEGSFRSRQQKGVDALIAIAKSTAGPNSRLAPADQASPDALRYVKPGFRTRKTSSPDFAEHDLPST